MREGLAVAAAEGVDIPAEEADHILQKVLLICITMFMTNMTHTTLEYDDDRDNEDVIDV